MFRPIVLSFAIVTISTVAFADAPTINGATHIIDGDTVEIAGERIRFWGVDAPELDTEDGSLAVRALEIALENDDWMQCQGRERDPYGRLVAQCYLSNGDDVAAVLVRSGYAIDWPRYSGGYYSKLEALARRDRIGLWDHRIEGWLN